MSELKTAFFALLFVGALAAAWYFGWLDPLFAWARNWIADLLH